MTTPPALSIVAPSGTGKTTLLEKLLAELIRRGRRVGAIKHDAHRFDIDHPGKDSWRLTRAGAEVMVISSRDKTAVVRQHPEQEPDLQELLSYCNGLDLVLTEGFKRHPLPKIEVIRPELGRDPLFAGRPSDPTLLAVAANGPVSVDVPVFDLDRIGALCDFIEDKLLR